MDSKNVLLSVTLCTAFSLLGCQTVKNDQVLHPSDASHQVKPVTWEKSGDMFRVPNDATLKDNESRIVFFRDAEGGEQPDNINIGIGSDNAFQVSLQEGYYSEKIICNTSPVINASVLNNASGDIASYPESYRLTPQTTTYLKVNLSKTGKPTVQQISADQALSSLHKSKRQTHQISRVSSDCNATNQTVRPELFDGSERSTQTQIKNLSQFNVLFDFDSTDIKSNNGAVLDGMANVIQSYPKTAFTLEGHTDNKGPERYNLRLSQARANVVKGALVNQYGIDSRRLSAVGYGESMPVDTNSTEQGRRNNRRVIATVSQGDN